MNVFAFLTCSIMGVLLMISSTIPAKSEPASHRLFQLFAGLSLLVAALYIAGVFR